MIRTKTFSNFNVFLLFLSLKWPLFCLFKILMLNYFPASTFYHGSHTKLGQVLDNFMISVIAYIVHQVNCFMIIATLCIMYRLQGTSFIDNFRQLYDIRHCLHCTSGILHFFYFIVLKFIAIEVNHLLAVCFICRLISLIILWYHFSQE